ncbi:MAG: hypothetical protein ACRDLN_08245 [Solirubrobacteraceae bacterium]
MDAGLRFGAGLGFDAGLRFAGVAQLAAAGLRLGAEVLAAARAAGFFVATFFLTSLRLTFFLTGARLPGAHDAAF